ncbi:MAG: hypothetical protein KDJ44_01880, partial [Rhodoblastus sp.]|nr:hypothetical protein [Rhodoblastus sp.]MCC2106213.1 hypothetical protein [Hyphomicrobiales bacterium]
MSDILLLDTGAVNRSISTGTKAAVEYFSAILQAAAAQGMRVELTDALYVEFRRSTVLRAILPELSAAGALGDSGVGVATSYAAQAANERLNNVIMPPDAGELSAFEYAQQCAKRGDVVTVFSDDAALFKNTAKLIDAGINPEFAEAITRNSSDMVAFVRANNAISAGESAAIYDVYTSIDQYNVSKAGKGWDPRQRFLAPSELEEILAKAPTPVVDYVQSFSRYAAKGIVIVGAAGLAYGLLTTAAKADDQIAAGDYEGAAATVASFGAGFAAALAAFEAGAAVGGACGSVAGPVGAAVGATLVGTAAAIIATGVAEEAAHAATQLLWSAVGSIFSTLEAVPQIISSVPSWFSMPLRAQLNSQFISPLVIDLTGGAIQTTALKGSQTFFDMAGIGHGQQTGWLSASCAFLARPNADGSITSISNLFGTDGSAANGFQSLAALDSNHDGKISAADAAFGSLVVWNDLNSDGVAETGETQTLAQVGVASISLSYATVATTSPAHMNNGNEIRQTSTVTMADGTTRVIADVWFATNPMMSQWAWHAPTAVQAALPDLPASGNLDSLQQSYANNPVLEQTAAALVAGASEMSYSDLRSAVEALVIQWARGSGAALPAGATLQQQRAAVMEAMGGQAFAVSMFNSDQQGLLAGGNVDHLYSMMLDTMTADIAMQVGSGVGGGSLSASVAAMFAGYAFDPATGDITPPASATLSQMQANGTFRQVLFQYMRDGAGAAPTTDAIWPLVAAWAANMPAGADLSQLVIDDNLGPFDVLSTSWSNDWAQPGIIDLMSKVSLPGQLPSIGFDARIGSDLFVYQKGAGDKVIWPWGGQMGAGTLYFADVSSKDVRIDGTGSSYRDLDGNIDKIDVTITILATGERVMLANPAFADGGIFTKIVLADGVVIDSAGFMALQNAVVFGKGDFGEVAAYTTKADTFVYASGDGAISIDAHLATGANVLKFADLNAANLTFTMDAAKNLIITDGVTGDRVTVLGQFTGATKIASFAFADGAVLAAADIQRKLVPTGSVVLAHGANFMASYGEIVDASAGANIVTGSAYNDRLIGGPGDTLQGGLGADTYVLAAGDGATTINDQGADKAADEIVFDPASNITAAGLKVKQSGIDLVVQYG